MKSYLRLLCILLASGISGMISLTRAQLIQHLDASVEESILTDDGSALTQWTDQSGYENHGIPHAGNVFKIRDDTHTWLDFGAARNSIQVFSAEDSDAWLDQAAGTGGFCVWIVFKATSLHSDWNDLIGNTSTALSPEGFGMRFGNTGKIQNYLAGTRLESSAIAAGEIVIFGLNFDAATGEGTFWDSNSGAQIKASIQHADFSLGNPVTLGSTTNSERYLKGYIGELKIYKNALTQADFKNEQEGLFMKWLVSESNPPLPDPAEFEEAPEAIYGTTIIMRASTGSDENGGVEYYFEETTGNPGGDDSGWQPYPYYSDGGLEPYTEYAYRVRMRDAFGNVGASSQVLQAISSEKEAWVNDLDSGAYYGYQAWHRGPEEGWPHWFDNGIPDAGHMSGDNWPDLGEYPILYETRLAYPDGSPVSVYSTSDYETVDVHIRWMKEYGIRGCFVQRQQLSIDNPGTRAYMDRKAMYVRRACEKYGVKFCMMPCNNDKTDGGRGQEYIDEIIADWKHCVDDLKITESPLYMHQDGKPVLGFWGLGFSNRDMTVDQATQILDSFQSPGESRYQVYVMGGVHHSWRTSPKEGWLPVFERLDMISPWRTIFYDAYSQTNIDRMYADKAWCDARGIDYNPVVSPGASTAYQNSAEKRNNFPREGGHYLWKQVYEVCKMGNKFMYVAMFDEIDEGTAMYKMAESQVDCPLVNPALVPLDEDGYSLPADWYLKVGTELQKMLDGRIVLTDELPITPLWIHLSPTPADGSTGTDLLPLLAWDGFSSADSFRVYLKEGSPPSSENELIATQTASSFALNFPLNDLTSYYWRVDAFVDSRKIKGEDWKFTTGATGLVDPGALSFQVFPNPAKEAIHISGLTGPLPYRIYNILGEKVHSGITGEDHNIDLRHLRSGIHVLLIKGRPIRFIKE